MRSTPHRCIAALTLFLLLTPIKAQDSLYNRNTTHATSFGVGSAKHLDTYLSPLEYSGLQIHFLRETLRPIQLGCGHVSFQGIIHTEFSMTQDKPEKGNEIGGSVSYSAAWHYNFNVGPLRLLAGSQISGTLGALYNTRNTNNPVQVQANTKLALSVAGIYGFHIKRQHFTVREQFDLALIGLMFSPDYGQSYYEIFSENNSGDNTCFTTIVNAPSWRNQLTIDFPLRDHTFRAGYLMDIRQSHVNHIKHHTYSHAFIIGWVKHFTYKKRRQALRDNFIM